MGPLSLELRGLWSAPRPRGGVSPPEDTAICDDSPYEPEGVPLVPGRLAEGER
jgi:hypothetical protein